MDDEADDEEESAEEGDTEQDRGTDQGVAQWQLWVGCVDAVSETCRCSFNEVWEMPVIEFLNYLCYRKDKMEREKRQMEKWRRTH